MTHTYGLPCFMDGSTRSITITDNDTIFFRTVYVQGMKEVKVDPNETLIEIFTEYKSKLGKEDKRLFKSYFDSL